MINFALLCISLVLLVGLAQVGLLPNRLLSLYALVLHSIKGKARFAPKKQRYFNYTEIVKGIIVGSQPRVEAEVGALKLDKGVTAFLSLNEARELYVPESCSCFENIKEMDIDGDKSVPIGRVTDEKILRLSLPVPDYQGPSQETLVNAIKFVDAQVRSGGKVFIHCNGGKGRSVSVVLAYLLASDSTGDKTIKDVWTSTKQRRKQTSNSLLRFPFTSQARNLRQFDAFNRKNPVLQTFERVPVSQIATEFPQ